MVEVKAIECLALPICGGNYTAKVPVDLLQRNYQRGRLEQVLTILEDVNVTFREFSVVNLFLE